MNLDAVYDVVTNLTLVDVFLGAVAFVGIVFVAVEGYNLNLRLLKYSAREVARDLRDSGLLDHPRNARER